MLANSSTRRCTQTYAILAHVSHGMHTNLNDSTFPRGKAFPDLLSLPKPVICLLQWIWVHPGSNHTVSILNIDEERSNEKTFQQSITDKEHTLWMIPRAKDNRWHLKRQNIVDSCKWVGHVETPDTISLWTRIPTFHTKIRTSSISCIMNSPSVQWSDPTF